MCMRACVCVPRRRDPAISTHSRPVAVTQHVANESSSVIGPLQVWRHSGNCSFMAHTRRNSVCLVSKQRKPFCPICLCIVDAPNGLHYMKSASGCHFLWFCERVRACPLFRN